MRLPRFTFIVALICTSAVGFGCSSDDPRFSAVTSVEVILRDSQGRDSCRFSVSGDSAADVVSVLNDARREPLKFFARIQVRLARDDGSSRVVLVNGSALKDSAGTYKAETDLEEKLRALAAGRCRDLARQAVSMSAEESD